MCSLIIVQMITQYTAIDKELYKCHSEKYIPLIPDYDKRL